MGWQDPHHSTSHNVNLHEFTIIIINNLQVNIYIIYITKFIYSKKSPKISNNQWVDNMASSVDEWVGKFQCMLGVLSIIVSISGTTNACWLAWNQNERHPSTKAERQGWLSGASWWSWQMLNWSFLQLFLRGLSSLAFVSGEWMRIVVRYVSLAILCKMLAAYFSMCHHFFYIFLVLLFAIKV